MIGAMMPPLMVEPLRHVRERVFASRRLRAMSLFTVGYLAIWVIAGLASQSIASVARWGMANPLPRLALTGAVVLAWQVSPAKQWFLNLCHRWPSLPAFGMAA